MTMKDSNLVPVAAGAPDVTKVKLELGKIHAELPGLFDKAVGILDKGRSQALVHRHALGQVFSKAYSVGSKHGSSALASALGISPDDVRHMRLFAERYDRHQLQEMIQQHTSEKGIDWAHIRLLVSVDDVKERTKLQQAVITRKWTVAELAGHIQDKYGKKSGGGRPIKASVPSSLFGATKQLTSMLEKMRVQAKALFGQDEDDTCTLFELLDNTPADKITDDVEERVEKMASELTEMAESTSVYLERCEQALERIREAKSRADDVEDGSDVEDDEPVTVPG